MFFYVSICSVLGWLLSSIPESIQILSVGGRFARVYVHTMDVLKANITAMLNHGVRGHNTTALWYF